MRITYCDLCSSPVKDQKYTIVFYKYKTESFFDNDNSIKKTSEKIPFLQGEKEVCEMCYTLVEEIFKKRFVNLCELAEYIRKLYDKPSKKPKYHKKK